MVDLAAMLVLADLPAVLTSAYWVCLIVGGGLLIISSLGGGDSDVDVGGDALDVDLQPDFDADFQADLSHDVDFSTDHVHAISGLSTWFSVRFMVFFTAFFGACGVVLTHLSQLAPWLVLLISLVGGLLVGQGVHQLIRFIRRTSGDSTPGPQDYVDKLARVTIALTPQGKGEVALRVGGSQRYMPAVSRRSDAQFHHGDQVVVVAYRDGALEVVSREDYRQLVQAHQTKGGTT